MTQKLQQAIQLARQGDKQKAQYLLTQTLQEEPENTQAWYLLSLLVDSEAKQAAYLQRVLALDPAHEKAQSRLSGLMPASATPEPEPAGEELDWLDDEMSDEAEEWFATTAVAEPADQPDWQQPAEATTEREEEAAGFADDEDDSGVTALESLSDLLEETETEDAQEIAPVAAPKAAAPAVAKPKSKDGQLTAVLLLLIILAILVGALLIYLIVTL